MNEIEMYMHCRECLQDLPPGKSMQDYVHLSVGQTTDGALQVWCERHELSVAKIALPRPVVAACSECEAEKAPSADPYASDQHDKWYEAQQALLAIARKMNTAADFEAVMPTAFEEDIPHPLVDYTMDWDYELLDAADALLRAHAEYMEALEQADRTTAPATVIEAPASETVN